MKVLNPNEAYTFSKIFGLIAEVDDIVSDFGYSLTRNRLNLPSYGNELGRIRELSSRINKILPFERVNKAQKSYFITASGNLSFDRESFISSNIF